MQETQQASINFPVTTFQVVEFSDTVTDAWLTRTDVEPKLTQNQEGVFILSIRNQGEFGKFETPYIGSQIIHADENLVAILVAFHGTEAYGRKSEKRVTKGQFWRYYQCDDGGVWSQVVWKQLDESERQTILPVPRPTWGKVPGKLKAAYAASGKGAALTTMMSYKIVRVVDGRYYSVYKSDEEYELGKLKKQAAKPGHQGGYFSYPDAEMILRIFEEKRLFDRRCYQEAMHLALLEVEVSGRIIEYRSHKWDGIKWASTYLRPLRILGTLEYNPN